MRSDGEPLLPKKEGELAAFVALQGAFPGGVHRLDKEMVPLSPAATIPVRVEVPLS